jgi:hypothetical protein
LSTAQNTRFALAYSSWLMTWAARFMNGAMSVRGSQRLNTFAETAALFAVMDGDLHKARSVIADLFPHERKMFADQLTRLLNMLGEPCQECGGLTPVILSVTTPVFGPDSRYLCRKCAGAADKPVSGKQLGEGQ